MQLRAVEMARQWLVGARGAEGMAVGGRLGSALFLVQGFTAAGTAWAFPEAWVPLLLFAASTLALGLVLRGLPWRRWPRWSLLFLPVGSLAMLAATGSEAPGVLPAYLAFFTLSFVYTGL